MRAFIFACSAWLVVVMLTACGGESSSDQAASIKANDVETTTYYFGLIRRGPAWTPEPTPKVMELQKQHLANISRLADAGLLILAGPFLEQGADEELAGIFIYKVDSEAEAESLAESDPAVQAGRLVVDIYPWLGSGKLIYDEPVEMTTYFMTLFSRGPAWQDENAPAYDDLRKHMKYGSTTLADTTRLVVSGPFIGQTGADALEAICILRAESLDQAEAQTRSVPGVGEGRLTVKILKWYGPEGLRE